MSNGLRVGVLGATGAVGSTILEVLAEREFPAAEVVLASERSAKGSPSRVQSSRSARSRTNRSRDWTWSSPRRAARSAPSGRRGSVDAGAVVVDNTSFWRMHEDVPLVVAEVNPDHSGGAPRLGREPELHDDGADGRGRADPARGRPRAVDRLDLSVGFRHRTAGDRRAARADPGRPRRRAAGRRGLSAPDRFNVLPQVETFKDGDDYTTEERKVMAETRKVLGIGDEVGISATCARVPVVTGHSISANVETKRDLSPAECRELLAGAPGLVVVDSPGEGIYPLPRDVEGRDEVLVGRIRRDPSHNRCLNLWVVGDNLRKGAATNAVQVAELLVERDLAAPRACLGVRVAAPVPRA